MKVLIWNKDLHLKDIGGPSGYLFKLRNYLSAYPINEIAFYKDVVREQSSRAINHLSRDGKIKEWIKSIKFMQFIYILKLTYYTEELLTDEEIKALSSYNAVHIHSVPELLKYHRSLHENGFKIIMTTHTPEPFTCEFFSKYGYWWLLKYFPCLKRLFINRELRAFDYTDFIMFPVPEAKEAYTNGNKAYTECFARNNSKFFYVPTAIEKEYSSFNEGLLDKKVASASSFRVCYIGRHNYIKGYDTLLIIARKVWERNPDVEFVIGGKEGPLFGIKDKRWHEMGWVSTYNLLTEVDVFILPNKETYYDLILLEVLRSGIPVILTDTGGSKWFKQYPGFGLFFYEYGDNDVAANHILVLSQMKASGSLLDYGRNNKQLFLNTSVFDKYIALYIHEITKRLM